MSQLDANSRTLFVRNIPISLKNEELESHFSNYGPIKRCFIILNKENKKSRGFGYISFVTRNDAESAVNEEHKINGNKLIVNFSDSRTKPTKEENDEVTKVKKIKKKKPDLIDKKIGEATIASNTVVISPFKTGTSKTKIIKSIKKLKKLPKYKELIYPADPLRPDVLFLRFDSKYIANNAILILKRWNDESVMENSSFNIIRRSQEIILSKQQKQNRLIIRNLSYKCDKQLLSTTFSEFGKISDIVIPKMNKGGKKVGCAFIQFLLQSDAKKAISAMNGRKILDRIVAIDWSISKNQFTENQKKQDNNDKKNEVVKNSEDDGDKNSEDDEMQFDKLDCEKMDEGSSEEDGGSSDEDEGMVFEKLDCEKMEEDEDEDISEDEESENNSENESNESADDDDDDDDTSVSDNQENKQKDKKESDVNEGKTLFIRNLPFESTSAEISELFTKHGDISYCKIVKDKQTDHSKGCAFIKFKDKSHCEEAFRVANFQQAGYGAGILLQGRKLLVSMAISHDDVQNINAKSDEKKVKDLRNLGLVREGLIRGGTLASEGLSQQDLDRRQKLEAAKRLKLKDLNTFVSTTRLSIHNIPLKVSDGDLKDIFYKLLKNQSETNNVLITECRIMRDMKIINADGKGKSRGFAFINFQEHKHALIALRLTNNNPEIFGEKKRLIVEFSLENKAALQLKERRMQRSMLKKDQKQHVSDGNKWKRPSKDEMSNISLYKGEKQSISQPTPMYRKVNKEGKQLSLKQQSKIQKKVNTGLSSHWGEKIRHNPREANLNKGNPKKRKFEGIEKIKTVSKNVRKNKKQKNDDFDKIVNSYSKKFSNISNNKWYE